MSNIILKHVAYQKVSFQKLQNFEIYEKNYLIISIISFCNVFFINNDLNDFFLTLFAVPNLVAREDVIKDFNFDEYFLFGYIANILYPRQWHFRVGVVSQLLI